MFLERARRIRILLLSASLVLASLVSPIALFAQPPRDASRAHQEGLAFAKNGQFPRAREALGRAVSLDPSFAEAWADLGNIELALGNMTPAITAFERALKVRPELQTARYNLAYSLRNAKAFDRAAEHYRLYLQRDPDDPDALYGLGEALRAVGDLRAAAEAYEAYARVEERPGQAKWVAKARELTEALRAQAARDPPPASPPPGPAGRTTPAPSPASPPTASASPPTVAAGSSAQSPEARDAQVIRPHARPSAFETGLTGLKQGDFRGALGPLSTAAHDAPDDALVLAALGSAHLGLRQGKESEVAYRRALKTASKGALAGIYLGLGEALRLQGEDREAREAYRSAQAHEAAPEAIKKLAGERLRALR